MKVVINNRERDLNRAEALALAEWMKREVGPERFMQFAQEFVSVALSLRKGQGCRLHIGQGGAWQFTVEDEP
jgi:hypothetical protein